MESETCHACEEDLRYGRCASSYTVQCQIELWRKGAFVTYAHSETLNVVLDNCDEGLCFLDGWGALDDWGISGDGGALRRHVELRFESEVDVFFEALGFCFTVCERVL